ncbi:MAG: nucleotidyltransferase family protein [Chloroflexi bacterium]|nr:nucleotidyltransferase family protein [Chloroflexota bacterium]
MLTTHISIHRQEITAFCHRWWVVELALFGSVLRDDFSPESDVDVLVTFAPEAEISLFDMAQMQIELQGIFSRPVDILEKDALRNPYRKREILNTAQVVYAA